VSRLRFFVNCESGHVVGQIIVPIVELVSEEAAYCSRRRLEHQLLVKDLKQIDSKP
jgi:hypothetical protein